MRTERTRKMCGPSARPEYWDGDSHSLNCSPSIAHSNVARFSLATNAKATVASPPASGSIPPVIGGGPKVICVFRPTDETTLHSYVATGESTAASSPSNTRTWNSCGPSGRPLYAFGEKHGENSPPSREHSYRLFGTVPSASNSKRAERSLVVRSGPAVISTGSGIAPTSQLHSAGVRSTLPAPSTARARNSCSPGARSVRMTGFTQGRKNRSSAASP